MGMKVDISEVRTLSSDLKSTANEIDSALDAIRTSIERINNMNSFSGKAAKNAKDYFIELHGSLIDSLQELYIDLEANLTDHLNAFEGSVDSSTTTIVESDYLNEIETDVNLEYSKLSSYHQSVERTIQNVNDISAASPPEMYSATRSKRDAEDVVIELESNLSSFTKEGKSQVSRTKEFLQRIERTINTAGSHKGEARFTDFESGTAKKEILNLKGFHDVADKISTGATGFTTSRAIYEAAQNEGLSVSKYTKNGKIMYRINASEDALKALGVVPDSHAKTAIKRNKQNSKAPLNYYDSKTGTQVWSKTGQNVLKKHPSINAWNDKASILEKSKTVARETGKGAVKGLTDIVDLRGINNSGIKGATKVLGPIGAGLSYYSNYHDAKANGLNGKEAHSQARTNTVVDVTISSAVQAGFTAAGTAFIPIPGVGTAIGVIGGIIANTLLNAEFGKSGKSIMDRAKGAVNKIKGWFS